MNEPGVNDPGVRGRTSRTAARAARLVLIVAVLLAGGGLTAIIVLGPAGARWLMAGGFNRTAAHRLWMTAPEGIPPDFLLHLRDGLNAYQGRQYQDAVAFLTAAIQADTNVNTLETLGPRSADSQLPETHLWRLDIEVRVTRADALQSLGRYDEALEDLDEALRLNGRHYENRQQRGVTRMLAGRLDDAIADFDALLAARNSTDVVFARGLAKYQKRDWPGAADDFAHAVGAAPDNSKYIAWLANAHMRATQTADTHALTAEDILRAVYGRGARPGAVPLSNPLSGP